MIQVKEFSKYSVNNEALTNKWIQENNDKYAIVSVATFYNHITTCVAYVITYKTEL